MKIKELFRKKKKVEEVEVKIKENKDFIIEKVIDTEVEYHEYDTNYHTYNEICLEDENKNQITLHLDYETILDLREKLNEMDLDDRYEDF